MWSGLIHWAKRHPVAAFFGLTYLIAWGVWVPLGLFAPRFLRVAALPGAWSPTLAALVLTALLDGKPGVRRLIGRAWRWRVGLRWWAAALFGLAAIALAAAALSTLLGGAAPQLSLPPDVPRQAWPVVVPILFAINVFAGGPLAEEAGWRGFALPRLQPRLSALTGSLVIGVLWALWHLPFFVFTEAGAVVAGLPFGWYAALVIGWSVLFAWAYTSTGSLLVCILLHAAANTVGSLGLLGAGAGAGGGLLLGLNVALTWLAVGLIVTLGGKGLTRRHDSAAAPAERDAPQASEA